MKSIKLVLKGILIGIGKIIPGVSGGIIAISLGVYEKAIDSINNIFKDFKKNIKYLSLLFTGVIISVIFMSGIVLNLLEKFYFPTMLLFVGLIVASLNDIKKSNNYFALTFICFVIICLFGIFNQNNLITFENDIYKVFFFTLAGIVDAITMIIPGISGTAVLMMMGCYQTLMKSFASFTHFYISYNNFMILLPFFIGLIIGSICTLKLVNLIFKRYNDKAYACILGVSYGTIFIMLLKALNSSYTFSELIIGIVLMIIGYFGLKKINC